MHCCCNVQFSIDQVSDCVVGRSLCPTELCPVERRRLVAVEACVLSLFTSCNSSPLMPSSFSSYQPSSRPHPWIGLSMRLSLLPWSHDRHQEQLNLCRLVVGVLPCPSWQSARFASCLTRSGALSSPLNPSFCGSSTCSISTLLAVLVSKISSIRRVLSASSSRCSLPLRNNGVVGSVWVIIQCDCGSPGIGTLACSRCPHLQSPHRALCSSVKAQSRS